MPDDKRENAKKEKYFEFYDLPVLIPDPKFLRYCISSSE
jgi:hypothetical protein